MLKWPLIILGGGFILYNAFQQGARAYKSLDYNIVGGRFVKFGWLKTDMELKISIKNESDLTPKLSNILINLSRNGKLIGTVRSTDEVELLPRDFTEMVVGFTVSNAALLLAAGDAIIKQQIGEVKATGVLTVAGIDYPIDEVIEFTSDEKTEVEGGEENLAAINGHAGRLVQHQLATL